MPRLLAVAVLTLGLTACAAPRFDGAGPVVTTPAVVTDGVRTRDGVELPLRSWLPEGEPAAVIVGLHGFNDYSNAFTEAGRWLSAEGLAVYAYDQRGFGAAPDRGRWPGTETLTRDLADVVAAVRARHPGKRVVVLGESMGGAVTLAALASDQPPAVDGVVLSAPAVWGRASMPLYQRLVLAVMARVAPEMELTGKGLDVWPSNNVEMLIGLSRDPMVIKATRVDTIYGLTDLMDAAQEAAGEVEVPVLWLYGARDEVVPPTPTLEAAAALDPTKGQRFVLYPNGWHMLFRDLGGETVLHDVAAWAVDPEAPLPSDVLRQP